MARNYRVTGRSALGAAVAKIRAGATRTLISGETYDMTADEVDAARAAGMTVEPDSEIDNDTTPGLMADIEEVDNGI